MFSTCVCMMLKLKRWRSGIIDMLGDQNITTLKQVVQFLESLTIMPKTMPGLHKIKQALIETTWFSTLDAKKIIVVAGTNGKGSTSAYIESLLSEAKQKVGLYSSPHLVSTTERIRVQKKQIAERDFVELFQQCRLLIEKYELSHFEALTLMAGHYFFSTDWSQNLDYVIFEVGLGGTFDATNAFPHQYSVITSLGLDHTNILGKTLQEVASNKFGIVHLNNVVVHHRLPETVQTLQQQIQKRTNSKWIEAVQYKYIVSKNETLPQWYLETPWGTVRLSLLGPRSAENAATALALVAELGFDCKTCLSGLSETYWPGRMQRFYWPELRAPLFLSGDHNPQGIQSLIEILKEFRWRELHLIIGIGQDKEADEMLNQLVLLPRVKLYLTETPFKGRALSDYPVIYQKLAYRQNSDVTEILKQIALDASNDQLREEDLVVVTGSLYLVGAVLREVASYKERMQF